MASIKDKIVNLQTEIGPTKLMVVTKKRSASEVREAIKAGVKFIGENTLQEIEDKYDLDLFRELKKNGVQLHFIGHLQKNKVNKVVRYCDAIQSVDSLELAKKINDAAKKLNKIMPVFLELNLTGELQKYGIVGTRLPAEEGRGEFLREIITKIQQFKNLRLLGFMTIGKQGDPETTRQVFRQCRILANDYQLPEVSMGMSEDYRIALEEGSTMVRLGRMVFE